MSDYMYSPCRPNGPWFRYVDNGYIEVQGIGIPTFNSFPKNVNQWKNLIDTNASKWQIPPSIIAAFICQESQGHEKAVSTSNAYGLMQMILSTAKNWGNSYFGINRNIITVQSLFDPEFNVKLGSAGLAHLIRKYNNNIAKTAAEYNSGGNFCNSYCNNDRWGLKTNCGYIDGIIKYNNTAINNGYSGVPILIPRSSGWVALAFLTSVVIGGSIVVFGAKKGLF